MTGPVLTMAEAARACGVSVSTLRRRRDALVAHGATRRDASWAIPITALVGLGLMPRVTPPDASPDAPLTPVMTGSNDAPLTGHDASRDAERDELRRALADAERRAAVAEAIAIERERIITTQSQALRLLEARPSDPAIPAPAPVEPPDRAPQPPAPRGFFARLFNQR